MQQLCVHDTAGASYPAMRDNSISKGHVFAVIYAIDDFKSYRDALELIDFVREMKNRNGKRRMRYTRCSVNLYFRIC